LPVNETQSKQKQNMKTETALASLTEISFTETGLYAQAICGNVSALVVIEESGWVRVICQNAAHKAWRGFGRRFPTVAEAIAAYKKPEMKAIIAAVDLRNS
jgi:hypothetical protein